MKMLPPKYRKIYTQKRKNYEKYFENIVTEMKEKGYFEGLDTKIVTFAILGMLNSIPRWYKAEGRLTIKEISRILCQMIVNQQTVNDLVRDRLLLKTHAEKIKEAAAESSVGKNLKN
jgi:hypothetical protein